MKFVKKLLDLEGKMKESVPTKLRGNVREKESKPSFLPDRSLKTLANSIYATLREEGCEHKDIIGVSSKLIGLVTQAMNDKSS